MDFQALLSDGAALAPEVLLTPNGPKRDLAIQFSGSRITKVGALRDFPQAVSLPGRAIVPGFVDAHTHMSARSLVKP